MNNKLTNTLIHHRHTFHPVVGFNPKTDKLLLLDFTASNTELTEDIFTYTKHFAWYINKKLEGYKYGIGGYNEDRILYKRIELFDGKEKRSIHLGIDIWATADTKVYAPLGGMIHSFAFNNNFGDYGATIVLQHQVDTIVFHTLYGHLSLKDIAHLQEGKYISRGEVLGHFGETNENGDWPPHLHFQIIEDMRICRGDYPGVCSITEREKYLLNCPDPDLVLNMMNNI